MSEHDPTIANLAKRLSQILSQHGADTKCPEPNALATAVEHKSLDFRAEGTLSYGFSDRTVQHYDRCDASKEEAIAHLDHAMEVNGRQDWLGQMLNGQAQGEELVDVFAPIQANFGMNCPSCNSRGKTPCQPCSHTGKIKCTNWNCSYGKESCSTCDGTGKNKCFGCYGSGKVETRVRYSVPRSDGTYVDDYRTEHRNCSNCAGAGRTGFCIHCIGSGKVDCGTCKGTAKITCTTCDGAGENVCHPCRGAGAQYFTITRQPQVSDRTNYQCDEDQSLFDTYQSNVPGFLEQEAAKAREGLAFDRKGTKADYTYRSRAHVVLARGASGQPAAILGHEERPPVLAPDYLARLREGAREALHARDFSRLSEFQLGQEVIALIRNREEARGKCLTTYDPQGELDAVTAEARNDVVTDVTKGERPALALVLVAAGILTLFSNYRPLMVFLDGIGLQSEALWLSIVYYWPFIALFALWRLRGARRVRRSEAIFGQAISVPGRIGRSSLIALIVIQFAAGLARPSMPIQMTGGATCDTAARYGDLGVCSLRFALLQPTIPLFISSEAPMITE